MNFEAMSDLLVVSDMDGTFMDSKFPVPEENIEAIRGFIQSGGHFTFATGRSVEAARIYLENLPIDLPVVLCNGACIYDFKTEKILWGQCLPESAKGICLALLREFPEMGAVVLQNNYYDISGNEIVKKHLHNDRVKPIRRAYDEISPDWFKVLFIGSETDMVEFEKVVAERRYPDVYFVSTGSAFLEMMPAGINKAVGIRKLCELIGSEPENVCAIGDYYNDLEMIQEAGFGGAMGQAPEQVKQAAKLVVEDCLNGGLAQFIRYIESKHMLVTK